MGNLEQTSADISSREMIGLSRLPSLSDAPSPVPVDRAKILDLFEGRLSNDEFRRVYSLIHTYREWHNAELAVILEQYEVWRRLKESLGELSES
jgi:hypothetical protein